MPRTGQTISHPQTGETLTYVRTAADTGGAIMEATMWATRGGAPPAAHVHPKQVETFTIRSGRVRLVVDGETRVLGAGDVAVIPAGVPHVWTALDDLEMSVTLEPALTTDAFFEDYWVGLAHAGRTKPNGMPRLLDMAELLDDHRDVIYLASAPVRAQQIAMALLAKVARLRRRQAATGATDGVSAVSAPH